MAILLTSGNPLGLRALGSGGRTAIASYEQIARTLRQSLGADHAALFAEPNRRPSSIDWFTTFEGNGPAVRLVDAPPDRKERGLARLGELVHDIEAKTVSLQKSDRQDERILGDMLGHALEIPDEQAVFLVDDQPVMTFWGFVKDQGRPALAPLHALLRQRVTPKTSAASPDALPQTQPGDRDATERRTLGKRSFAATPRGRMVPVVLWTILALLLLTSGVELLRGCAIGLPYALTGWLLDFCPASGGTRSADLDAERSLQDQLRGEYDDLVRQAALKRQACLIKPPEERRRDTPTPIVTPKPVIGGGTDQLKIPDKKTNDFDFLSGCWRAHEGLHDSRDPKQMLVVTYCFDSDGSGERTIRYADDNAKCTGSAHAHFVGDVLVIDFAQSPCEGTHGNFSPASDQCRRGENNVATCDEASPDSSKPNFKDFPFTRTTEQP